MTIEQPPHPVQALTTYELRNYRRDLEQSLGALPEQVAMRVILEQRLAQVLAEQDSRNRLHQANGQARLTGKSGTLAGRAAADPGLVR
jgi:hypothetical protein